MHRTTLLLAGVACAAAWPLAAQEGETRQLGAHVHGESHLTLAAEGRAIAMELHAPGVDILGFEHEPATPEETAAVEGAELALSDPIALFGIPEAAGCSVMSVEVGFGHEEHGEEHAEEPAGADHEEEEGEHLEFDADYEVTCDNVSAIESLDFAYFATFTNAVVMEVEMVTDRGAFSFEVGREQPKVDTRGMF